MMKLYLKKSTRHQIRRRDTPNPKSRTIDLSAPNARIAKRDIAAQPYPPSDDPTRCACGNRLSVADTGGVCLVCREVGA